MLAAHEARAAHAESRLQGERQQAPWLAIAVTRDDDERRQARALTDLTLPRGEEVEPLKGRDGMTRVLKTPPDHLGGVEILDDVDGGDAR
ncbi:hypothetical protein ACVIHH_006430 [Bradyrhizobium sp. USDA 4518]